MLKYKCNKCGACFNETEAETHSELIDISRGYSPYFEHYVACPECNSWEDIAELSLGKECQEYDEEFGCEGNCEDCPMNGEE